MELYIGVSRSDGTVAHVAMQLEGRFPSRPRGGWTLVDGATWKREGSDANIEYELARINQNWVRTGDATMVGWRILSPAEHEMFNQNRQHRNALEDVGGKIQYNMVKARELHREFLRHYNGDKLIGLDREWVNASAAKDTLAVTAVEAKRAALAASVTDPRIEAAQTIEELLLVAPAAV